jgi:hypothetical protein
VKDRFPHRTSVVSLAAYIMYAGLPILANAASAGTAPAKSAEGLPWWVIIAIAVVLFAALWLVLRRGGGRIDVEAYLIVKSGEREGTRLRLEKAKTSIGAQDDNDLVLTDDHISRHHALLVYEKGAFVLNDLNSLYGTFVGGKRIEEESLPAGRSMNLGKSVDLELIVQQ